MSQNNSKVRLQNPYRGHVREVGVGHGLRSGGCKETIHVEMGLACVGGFEVYVESGWVGINLDKVLVTLYTVEGGDLLSFDF